MSDLITITRKQYEADIAEAKAQALHALADEVFADNGAEHLRWEDFVFLARTRADQLQP